LILSNVLQRVAAGSPVRVRTPAIFDPASAPANEIASYALLVIGICAALFLVVGGLTFYALLRFRARPGDDEREPPQIYASSQIEIAWTVVPIVIVFLLALVTARTILVLQKDEAPIGSLEITAIGHQWWWEFHYPEYGFTTANELHIPLSDPSDPWPTFLDLQSQDVIHSFWVPRLSGKTDVVPNRTNHLWMAPTQPGVYVGQCAEYCGTQHAGMLLRVVVESRADFERWVERQRGPAVSRASLASEQALFEATACISCHRIRGTRAQGRFGPDLTHLMSRETLGAGVARNDRSNLIQWVASPDHFKPGALMPAMQLPPDQVERIVDYLVSLE
jgi:cytochrome c oxidase subunit 2